MRQSNRNLIVSALAFCFLFFNFAGEKAAARNDGAADALPTPKKASATPAPAAKKTPDAKSKSSPKASDAPTAAPKTGEQIIVTATNVTVRQQASTKSARLASVKLGKILPVFKKGPLFYQVEYEAGRSGWISTTYTRDFNADKRETVYREIVDKYVKNKKIDLANALEVTDFLQSAQAYAKSDEARAAFAYKRLQFIAAALKAIPFGKGEQFPYKNFVKANERDAVYSEPSGEWYARAESFWELHEKFAKTPIAEEIAWTAANNPIAGECEGYINCYLYNIRAQDGEYLNFYPNGKHAQKSLTNIGNYLEPFVADLKDKAVYTPPTDISDRAEFNRFLTELRAIVSKSPHIEKNKVLKQINDLGEGYK